MHFSGDDETPPIALAHLLELLRRSSRFIVMSTSVGAVVCLLWALTSEVSYTANATFREGGKREEATSNTLSTLLLGGNSLSEGAAEMLKSRKIVEEMVSRLGLQVTIAPDSRYPSILKAIGRRLYAIQENLRVEYALLTDSHRPALADHTPELQAIAVHYSGEQPLNLTLMMNGEKGFTVFDSSNQEVARGTVGMPCSFDSQSFTLIKTTQAPLVAERYAVSIMPTAKAVDNVTRSLTVTAPLSHSQLLRLGIRYPSRQMASAILNSCMAVYRDHLIAEHHEIKAQQLAYLNQRQQQLDSQLISLMEKYAGNLATDGGDFEMLMTTQQKIDARMIATELELHRLTKALEGDAYCPVDSDPIYVHTALNEIRECRQRCSALTIALGEQGNSITSAKSSDNSLPASWQTTDLDTANKQFIRYGRQLQDVETEMSQHAFIIQQLNTPDFEVSSLTAVLQDPISVKSIEQASALSLSLKDSRSQTTREVTGLQQDLQTQKQFLKLHLQQVLQLQHVRRNLLVSSIQGIQHTSQQLLEQKISLIQNELRTYAAERIRSLQHEQSILSQQRRTLEIALASAPQQWAIKRLIDQQLKGKQAVMKQINSLTEAKNIEDNIEIVLSAPWDRAIAPLQADSPRLWLHLLCGAVLGAMGALVYILGRSQFPKVPPAS